MKVKKIGVLALALSLFCFMVMSCSKSNDNKLEEEAQQYICSMHPEKIFKTPGKCPKCNMDLIPVEGN